jgi:transcriptional regulator with XRE-family HTH domain/ElaB/YqjD/DUF883 family membrane-anchored ribosome-binding protein
MALWKGSNDGKPAREGKRVKNDLRDSVNENKATAASDIKSLVADVEDLMARTADLKDSDVQRVRRKVQVAVSVAKHNIADDVYAVHERAREATQTMPSGLGPSGLDADTEREEQRNVEILRRRVQAREAEDPDAAAFGWVARVGAALRRARDMRGLTQTVLSDGTNITQGYLSSLETGKLVRGPTVDVLYRYAAALDCDCEITLRDSQTGEVVTTVRSEPVERAPEPLPREAVAICREP